MLSDRGSKHPVLRQTDVIGPTHDASLFTTNSLFGAGIATAAYLLLSRWLIGFKSDQVILAVIFNLCFFLSRTTRRFILGFSVFIVYWIVFDLMKAFPNYRYNTVHIASLYEAEKGLFGIHWHQALLTPNEYFAKNATQFLDTLAGLSYLCWVPVPLAFAAAMFFKNRNAFFQFSLTFFLVNLIGFMGYYLYPAAPPWYVANYGFSFDAATPGNTAGLGRFDAHFGISVFKSIYAKSSNVFAAMPSLHASYMMIVLYYGLKFKLGVWNILFAAIMIGIWFAAIYSGHHYVLDVLAGMACAVLGITVFQLFSRTLTGKKSLNSLLRITEK